MNEIILEISAFGISAFCIVDCLVNRKGLYLPFPKGWLAKLRDRHFVYICILFTMIISTITSVSRLIMSSSPDFKGYDTLLAFNQAYFIFHMATSLFFTLYIMNITGITSGRGWGFFGPLFIPFIIAEAYILANPFTKHIFYIDGRCTYHRGKYMWVLYAIAGVYILYGVLFFFIRRKLISKFDRLATFILMSIAIIGIIVQGAFSMKVELFFESIAFFGYMLLLENEGYRGKTGRRGQMSRSFIVAIALIFISVITLNINVIYHAGSDQTEKIGQVQLNNVSSELQQVLSESESSVLRYAMGLEQLLGNNASMEEIEGYIKAQQEQYKDLTGGICFSVYASSDEWTIIPGFDFDESYDATGRLWYRGAKNHAGSVYISEPYIDADTGNMCYTFSYLLSDGKTVAAMDYTLAKIQEIVGRMRESSDQFVMIVTGTGTVLGSSVKGIVGEEIVKVMPQYSEVLNRVMASNEHKSFKTTIDGKEMIVFSSDTGNGWHLVLTVDHSSFYADIYDQIVLLGAIDILMVAVIIVFYMVSLNNQKKAESTLQSTENFIASLSDDLYNPLNDILRISTMYLKNGEEGSDALRSINDSGNRLKEKIDNLFSYSNMLKSETSDGSLKRIKHHGTASQSGRSMKKGITGILLAAILIGLTLTIGVTLEWGIDKIGREADHYNSEVAMWTDQKQSIINMFADVIKADPSVFDDYDRAVAWLNDIASNYSDITFAYLANHNKKEHQVVMNNGWVPDESFNLELRKWYVDTIRSESGYNISIPYFDAQTGLYCITFSRTVYDDDGTFIGVFAIDCLLDKLIDVLDNSYKHDSYAFMVDQNGTIINHPNKEYEIAEDNIINVVDTRYADVYQNGSMFLMKDYDGKFATCTTEKSNMAGFTVVVVQNWWNIYGWALVMGILFIFMIVISIVGVSRMINRFVSWQEESNEELIEAVNTAIAAEKAKSRFLAQMSHEIRTPINTVLGMNEMILRESGNGEIKEYAGNIRSAGKSLLGLINSILDFSKIEEGKMEIIPVRYNTVEMIENMINSVRKRADDKGLKFTAHIDPNLPSALYGDDMRVTQVATNLLTNAVKYTQEGSVDLFVDGTRSGENISLNVSVKDTGIGIKKEDMGRLFESFTRLEETRNRNIEGTGLGMSIVNRLLDMMGSNLIVKSEYGKGSEFAFSVSQAIADAAPIGDFEQRVKESLGRADDDTYVYAPDAKLLAVDDNRMNLLVINNLLKLNGIKPDNVSSGQEALDILREKSYDLILLDHMMPDMDGIETLKKAKEKDLIPEGCHVIALTANAVAGARESYIKEGFDDYLSKPIEVSSLESVLAKFLPSDKVSYRSRTEDDFSSKCIERIKELDDALDAEDLDRYVKTIKEIKSEAKEKGLKDVSKAAAAIEIAAGAKKIDRVRKDHAAFTDTYKEAAGAAAKN